MAKKTVKRSVTKKAVSKPSKAIPRPAAKAAKKPAPKPAAAPAPKRAGAAPHAGSPWTSAPDSFMPRSRGAS